MELTITENFCPVHMKHQRDAMVQIAVVLNELVILLKMARKAACFINIKRDRGAPAHFSAGQPNLVICVFPGLAINPSPALPGLGSARKIHRSSCEHTEPHVPNTSWSQGCFLASAHHAVVPAAPEALSKLQVACILPALKSAENMM